MVEVRICRGPFFCYVEVLLSVISRFLVWAFFRCIVFWVVEVRVCTAASTNYLKSMPSPAVLRTLISFDCSTWSSSLLGMPGRVCKSLDCTLRFGFFSDVLSLLRSGGVCCTVCMFLVIREGATNRVYQASKLRNREKHTSCFLAFRMSYLRNERRERVRVVYYYYWVYWLSEGFSRLLKAMGRQCRM